MGTPRMPVLVRRRGESVAGPEDGVVHIDCRPQPLRPGEGSDVRRSTNPFVRVRQLLRPNGVRTGTPSPNIERR